MKTQVADVAYTSILYSILENASILLNWTVPFRAVLLFIFKRVVARSRKHCGEVYKMLLYLQEN